MKNIIIMLAFAVALVGLSSKAEASTAVCGNPANSTISVTYVNCDNGSPENVVNVWGTTNSQLPHILQGQTSRLQNGQMFTCPFWFPMYCVDITGTAWFRARN